MRSRRTQESIRLDNKVSIISSLLTHFCCYGARDGIPAFFKRKERSRSSLPRRQHHFSLDHTVFAETNTNTQQVANKLFSPLASKSSSSMLESVRLPPLNCPGGPRMRAEGIKNLFKVPHAGILAKYDQRFILNLKLTHQLASYLSRTTLKSEDKVLLELGPGPGTLTRSLLTRPCVGVLGIEKDERFNAHLEQIKKYTDNKFKWFNGDVLELDELDCLKAAFPAFVERHRKRRPGDSSTSNSTASRAFNNNNYNYNSHTSLDNEEAPFHAEGGTNSDEWSDADIINNSESEYGNAEVHDIDSELATSLEGDNKQQEQQQLEEEYEESVIEYENAPLRSVRRERILRERASKLFTHQTHSINDARKNRNRSNNSNNNNNNNYNNNNLNSSKSAWKSQEEYEHYTEEEQKSYQEEEHNKETMNDHTSPNPAFDITDHWWADGEAKLEVIANLPFDVITELLMRYAVDCSRKSGIFIFGRVPLHVFTQKEIADRIMAPAGSIYFSRLSVLTQCYFHVRMKQTFTEMTYFPRTEVRGAMLTLEPRSVAVVPHLDGATLTHFTNLLMKPGQRSWSVHKALNKFMPPEVVQYVLQEFKMDGALTVLDLAVEEIYGMAKLWRNFLQASQQQQQQQQQQQWQQQEEREEQERYHYRK